MFDIGSSELLMIVIVAVVVIGPKDLPRALYKVGQILGKARSMSRHFRSGIDAMIREVELEEMEKKWAAENRRIMEQYPDTPAIEDGSTAPPADAVDPAGAETVGPEAADEMARPALPESAPPPASPDASIAGKSA